jgi:hypothetical protein
MYAIFILSNFFAQFLYNFCTTLTIFYFFIFLFFYFFIFLLSTIGFVFQHVGPKYSIVDLKKKKIVRIIQKLCKSCVRDITLLY